MISRRRHLTTATFLSLVLTAPLLTGAPAHSAPSASPQSPASATAQGVSRLAGTRGLALPRPTGPYVVGRRTVHLVDFKRADPWAPSAGARELMVSLSYPARREGGRPAPYMSEAEAGLLLESRGLAGVIPAATVSGARTYARVRAVPARGRFPLVVLSPGFSLPRSTLTSLADDLAGRGYVVATVGHAYESVGTLFPGGRMLTCLACEQVATHQEQAAATRVRAADLSFVISQLTGGAGLLSRSIDPDRVGVAGHSLGGAAAAASMAADDRVRAGINLDGDFFLEPAAAGLGHRPLLMLGTATVHGPHAADSDWPDAWRHLTGWKRWLTVIGAEHLSFTDFPYLADQLGLTGPDTPLTGTRAWSITRDYISAFFDLHLRGLPRPVLDGPTPAHPEVTFQPATTTARDKTGT
ncbi:alpha/beta hydrolase family protein [Streptomyces sp. NPDC016845]|uniref:alpha/beta hydrolase family protein n=1 Tax=Streptomyces sp. NPDC016845 TaxID=3364972 RepID=UPI0037A98506